MQIREGASQTAPRSVSNEEDLGGNRVEVLQEERIQYIYLGTDFPYLWTTFSLYDVQKINCDSCSKRVKLQPLCRSPSEKKQHSFSLFNAIRTVYHCYL